MRLLYDRNSGFKGEPTHDKSVVGKASYQYGTCPRTPFLRTFASHSVLYREGMTLDEARQLIIDGINYAAYKETDFSLHDSDKNRLFGSERYKSGRPVYEPSPWVDRNFKQVGGEFEEKMARLLVWANILNKSEPAWAEAQALVADEDSTLGRVIRRAKEQRR